MNALITLHDAVFDRIERLAPAVLPTLARLVFAGVLLAYFWSSAGTKLTGLFTLNSGAFAQIFPRKFEALGYDPSQFGLLDRLIIFAGSYAEYILPLLIVIGLLTRLAALGMIGFIVVQSLTDIYGHHADATTIGTWFDKTSGALIVDQRAFWMFLLIFLVFRGAGPLAADRFIFNRQAASG
jgi:putative oxidoreductase